MTFTQWLEKNFGTAEDVWPREISRADIDGQVMLQNAEYAAAASHRPGVDSLRKPLSPRRPVFGPSLASGPWSPQLWLPRPPSNRSRSLWRFSLGPLRYGPTRASDVPARDRLSSASPRYRWPINRTAIALCGHRPMCRQGPPGASDVLWPGDARPPYPRCAFQEDLADEPVGYVDAICEARWLGTPEPPPRAVCYGGLWDEHESRNYYADALAAQARGAVVVQVPVSAPVRREGPALLPPACSGLGRRGRGGGRGPGGGAPVAADVNGAGGEAVHWWQRPPPRGKCSGARPPRMPFLTPERLATDLAGTYGADRGLDGRPGEGSRRPPESPSLRDADGGRGAAYGLRGVRVGGEASHAGPWGSGPPLPSGVGGSRSRSRSPVKWQGMGGWVQRQACA